jgi:cell division septation protein DedD
MEQNFQLEPKVKEKSVYLLHLDGPRILILSAIVIGLLSVAFLVGMKLVGDDKIESVAAQSDSILDQQGSLPPLDSLDPAKAPLPDLQPPQTQPLQPAQVMPQDSVIPQSSSMAQQSSKKTDSDALSNGSHEIIPASKKISTSDAKKSSKSKTASNSKKSKKSKSSTKADKKNVVEVSDSKIKSDLAGKKLVHGFFVQIASFDKADKAKNEVTKLKDLDYDAHYDKKEVKGKDFFRVRIGPIATKEKALDMLDEIQENTKYEDSFIIHE